MVKLILPEFDIDAADYTVEPFGSGLINSTWRVCYHKNEYILQKINQSVFKKPVDIAQNVRIIADYLADTHPDYYFVEPIKTLNNEDLAHKEGLGYFRLTPFVPDSHTTDVVETRGEAFEAAKQFGKFSALLSELDASQLKITIPDFHNLQFRFEQFRESLENGNKERIKASQEEIAFILANEAIVSEYIDILRNPEFKLRVMHHDTKISNVLLDHQNKGICVIDLDTVMPGYFISDVGDMMRTYLSPESEEQTEFNKHFIREDIFEAIVEGYMTEMNGVLTAAEKTSFVYAGKFIIFMQAMRFLTDYFNDDKYYGARYPNHNYNRACNQICLLKKLIDKEPILSAIQNKIIYSQIHQIASI